jgi:hypothetical protein
MTDPPFAFDSPLPLIRPFIIWGGGGGGKNITLNSKVDVGFKGLRNFILFSFYSYLPKIQPGLILDPDQLIKKVRTRAVCCRA